MIGYAVSHFFPQCAIIWYPLMVFGLAGSMWLTLRSEAEQRSGNERRWSSFTWRYIETLFALSLFLEAIHRKKQGWSQK
jgi:hypothetical protein